MKELLVVEKRKKQMEKNVPQEALVKIKTGDFRGKKKSSCCKKDGKQGDDG